ncbi:MAG TPA: diguanylate cyclase [Thermotogota bacterium]|nr:diguanylate cyclase [Thermotogota bacterium]HRW93628.1 diguanylate cyclase [Thermotogota bacterium]
MGEKLDSREKLHVLCGKALREYLDAYFVERDFEKTKAFFGKKLSGFGTGRDEMAFDEQAFLSLYRRDFQQSPHPISYTIRKDFCVPVDDEVCVSHCLMDIQTRFENHELVLKDLRQTIVFRLSGGRATVEALHISFPAEVHGGDESYPLKEIRELTDALQERISRETKDLAATFDELERMATKDRLTGLLNRYKIDHVLQSEVSRSTRYNTTFSVVFCDIDGFKEINDTHGHIAGDEVLQELGVLFRQSIRETDFPGRWGGDEFLLLLPETVFQDAMEIAEKMRKRISNYRFSGINQVTVSFGVTSFMAGDSEKSLLQRADDALYRSKAEGKNRVAGQ